MDILTIKINGIELDLYPDEKVVQTFSLFNFNDITSRQSEYSNNFKVPKTNNNITIIDYSDYINNTTPFPFKKTKADIFINGFLFKVGFIELIEINDDINLRFYTGNIGYYDFIKQRSLKDIDMNNNPSLITIWDLFNVTASRAATSGVFFPLVDYNGMSDTGNSVDVRRLLPAYFKLSLIEAMTKDAGYSLVNELTGDALVALQSDIVPTATNKLNNNADYINLNSYEGSMIDGTGDTLSQVLANAWSSFIAYETDTHTLSPQFYKAFNFSTLVSGNPDRYVQPLNNLDYYQCALTGVYNISFDLDVSALFSDSWDSIPNYEATSTAYWYVQINGNLVYQIGSISVLYGYPSTSGSVSGNFTGNTNLNLNTGDIVRLVVGFSSEIHVGFFYGSISNTHTASARISNGSTFGITLTQGITFGTQINPAQCLPDIKQNDFLKDTCIRYCIIPFVDEDAKIVYLKEFKSVKDNLNNYVDWSSKVDETNDAGLTFKLGSYAKNNIYKHQEDKSVDPIPLGSDAVVILQNENLIQEKVIYQSPFAPSETITKLVTSEMIAIDLHDGTTFKKDVKPRCCYTRLVNRTISYTDGTNTTTVSTNIPHTWFISGARNYNAGFENGLLTDYSADLISIIQNPKVLKIDIKLTLIDILSLNYFYPIYLSQYNSYFFVSNVNQFDYTSNNATEVELIKLT